MREIQGFSVRAVKVLERASEETLCFQADVYLHGKKLGVATNEGRGGSNRYSSAALCAALEAAAAKMAPATERLGRNADEPFTFQPNADYLVSVLVDCARLAKSLERKMKTRIVLTSGCDQVFESSPVPAAELRALVSQGEAALRRAVDAKPDQRVLNHLPIDDAVDLVRGPKLTPASP